MTAAQFRLLTPAGDATAAGPADVQVTGGALVIAPASGDLLRVPFSHLTSLISNGDFTVALTLAGGAVAELSRLGRMGSQILAELRDGRADAIAAAWRPVGEPVTFTGLLGAGPVELRVYEDALLVIGDGSSDRVGFSFVSAIDVAEYVVTVSVTGRPRVAVSRLGRRTTELAELLASRQADARVRTAAFLGALLPQLDPVAVGQAAGLLRDGVAAPSGALDAVAPGLATALADLAVRPERRPALAELRRRGPLALGFKQVRSVRRAAAGVTPWQPAAPAAGSTDHGGAGGSFGPGLAGMMTAGLLENSGYGPNPAWALLALQGRNAGAGTQRPTAARPDIERDRLTPAADDVAAVTAVGDNPTVLAFVLGQFGDRVVLEILNQAGVPTFVYRAAGSDGLSAVNRALEDSGFQPVTEPGPGSAAASLAAGPARQLAEALAGEVAHDESWASRIGALLG